MYQLDGKFLQYTRLYMYSNTDFEQRCWHYRRDPCSNLTLSDYTTQKLYILD